MELPYDANDDDDECLTNMTLRTDVPSIETHTKECVVCGFIQNEWTYYQYPCGHYGHSRCVRKWFKTTINTHGNTTIQCPWCREQTPNKKYCKLCKAWTDHYDMDEIECPVMREFIEHLYDSPTKLPNEFLYQPRKISLKSYKQLLKSGHLGTSP